MASTASESPKGKRTSSAGKVLGWSSIAGRFVLRPASKPGKLSMREAKTAVRRALDKKL